MSSNSSNQMSPIAPPTSTLLSRSASSEDEEEFRFFRVRKGNILDDTPNLSFRAPQGIIDEQLGVPEDWQDVPLAVKVYIDDLNNIEKVRHQDAISIVSQEKQVVLAHATKSEENFIRIKQRAEEVNMLFNK